MKIVEALRELVAIQDLRERADKISPVEPGFEKEVLMGEWRSRSRGMWKAVRAALAEHDAQQHFPPDYPDGPDREPQQEPTQEMVTAYLTANDAYWKRVDAAPTKIGKWRDGTPSEATLVSLRAALAVAPRAQPAPAQQERPVIVNPLTGDTRFEPEAMHQERIERFDNVEDLIAALHAPQQERTEKTAYMDGIDWQYHVEHDTHGVRVYPTPDTVCTHGPECGVVRVRMIEDGWVTEQQERTVDQVFGDCVAAAHAIPAQPECTEREPVPLPEPDPSGCVGNPDAGWAPAWSEAQMRAYGDARAAAALAQRKADDAARKVAVKP